MSINSHAIGLFIPIVVRLCIKEELHPLFSPATLSIESESRLGAGRLCLEFANTVDWHASDVPQETLPTYAELLDWARKVGIVTEAGTAQIAERAVSQPQTAAVIHAQSI